MSEIPEGLELELHREDGGRQRHPRHPWAHRFHLFRCWEKWRRNSRKVLNPGYPNRCIQREQFPDEKKMTFLNPIKCYKLLQVGRSGIENLRFSHLRDIKLKCRDKYCRWREIDISDDEPVEMCCGHSGFGILIL